ncbi:epoxide hydrolase 4-like [Littorina saxatilis]|uniref:AB hydrolase-1 domain-containing protein n=1 Tax=Littorina saxatilis TaxID=31220 RepID=A0AAN9BGL8_9CAEN
MALVRALIERAITLAFSAFYGLLVVGKLLLDTVKLGPGTVLGHKKRSIPPKCLEDPSLGTHGYAHLEDIRMHYVSNGAEDKPLMLLVHGFPEFWYSWRYQLKEFKDNYRVVAVDLRGYGDSDKPPGISEYAVPKHVNDLKQFITALGYNDCVLVGHDWGGAIAWAFADMHPDMISRLVIMNCPNARAFNQHIQKSFTQFKMSWYMFFFQLPCLPEFALQFNDFAALDTLIKSEKLGVKSEYTTEDDMEAYKYNFTRNSFTGPVNFYRSVFSLANLNRDRKKIEGMGTLGITMPTLIIWGDQDGALDKPLAELSAKACKGKVEIKYVEGASHWVQMDRPDLVNKLIREFLSAE